MSSGMLAVVVIAVVVVLALLGLLLWPMLRRRRLREKFGPEYDRTLQEAEDRKAAERELAQRERRHSELELRELPQERKEQYLMEWAGVQEKFVDHPAEAMVAADRLVTTIMAERGYPTESYDQQVADLSVQHAATLGHYRTAHEIATRRDENGASTEEMRTAIVHYRELFQDLMNGHSQHSKDIK
ncbi:hypothetical protein [Nocardia sp. XZ_19_385]|uniref:hypothetical protein n=1 Tax=Nocardia sp. XZ_19_385 TaxID=2769488 RepID=UPI00188E75C7|nr:hypothetical protein [Nocardia sp. XZ_19_385]